MRMFTTVLLILSSATVLAQATRDFSLVEVVVHPVAGQVHYLQGSGGNIGVFSGEDGVFLVDDQFAPLTEKIVAAVRTISEGDIRFLVNTHHHGDHTGGNENLGRAGTLIVAHENVRERLMASMSGEGLPVITYSADLSFHLNGERVDVYKVAPAHTDGDSYIFFRGSNVLHVGDVYRNVSYPYIDVASGGTYAGTLQALQIALDLADEGTRIIPGHGVVVGKAEVAEFLDMTRTIGERVHALMREGRSLEEIQTAGITSEYDAEWQGTGNGTAEVLIATIFNEGLQ